MRKKNRTLIWMIPALLPALAACGGGEEAVEDQAAVVVETCTATRGPIEATLRLTGDVLAGSSVRLFGQVPDRITSMNVDVGARVRRGQVLARIRDESARAGVEQIEANLRAARSSLGNLRDELERSRSLHQAGALSSQALEALQTRTEAAQAQVEQLDAALTQARAALQNTEITAPFDGIVAERYLEAGDMAGPGVPVFRLVDMRKVRVVGDVSQERLGLLRPSLPARVRVSSYPGEVFQGAVSRISPVLDQLTRLATLEVEVPNEQERLRPGMFAEMEVVLSLQPDALLLPIDALLNEYRYLARESLVPSRDDSETAGAVEGTEATVYVVESGQAAARNVRIGLISADSVEVLEGLEEGEVVVTAGRYRLSDGDRVQVAEESGAQEGGVS